MGGYENLEFVWASETRRILIKDHPVLRNRQRRVLANTVPIGVHGGGAKFSHQDSIYVVSWNSLIGLGDTRSKRFVFSVLNKSEFRAGGATWDSL